MDKIKKDDFINARTFEHIIAKGDDKLFLMKVDIISRDAHYKVINTNPHLSYIFLTLNFDEAINKYNEI